MSLVDVTNIEALARKELAEEATEKAKEKIKELIVKREKAQLIVKNIDREIEMFMKECSEMITYGTAGVNS